MVRWFILFDVLLFPLLKMLEWLVLALVAYGTVWAYQGKYAEIPYLSDFVRSIGSSKAQAEEADPSEE